MAKSQRSAVQRRGHLVAWMALAWVIQGCGFYQPVEVAGIQGFDQVRWADGKLGGTFSVRLYNPNPYALHMDAADLDLLLNEEHIGKCHLLGRYRIPGDAGTDLAFEVKSDLKQRWGGLLGIGVRSLLGEAAVLRVRGTVTGKQFLITHRIAVNHMDTLRWR